MAPNIHHAGRARHTRAARNCRAAILAVAAAGFTALGPGPALASTISCGDTITADTTLHADLSNCPGDGLTIGADNITLDLNGHTIDGDATPGTTGPDAGIRLETHHGVTIENGTVPEFDTGVLLDAAGQNVLRQLIVLRSGARGIQLQNGSNGNRLESDASSDNGRSGIVLLSSDHNVVRHSTASDNAFSGFATITANYNLIEGNDFSDDSNGIGLIDHSHDNRVIGNAVSGANEGINIELSERNLAVGNHVFRNREGIIYEGDGNAVVANRITDGTACEDGSSCGAGIGAAGGTGNLVAGNWIARIRGEGIRLNAFEQFGGAPAIATVIRNNLIRDVDTDGIGVATSPEGSGTVKDTLLEANVVIGSGHDGINVASAATTLTCNLALHNANLGIEAVPGVTDGGGNHAAGNGNPAQCTNVAC